MPFRVTLRGRLCTTQESQSSDRESITKIKKDLRSQLTATVKASGIGGQVGGKSSKASDLEIRHMEQKEITRSTLETQGGNGLLASR